MSPLLTRCLLAGCVGLAFTLLAVPDAPAEPARRGAVPEYVYRPGLRRPVGVMRGNMVHVGHLDADGNFIEDRKAGPDPGSAPSGPGPWVRLALLRDVTVINEARRVPSEPVYEYRS